MSESAPKVFAGQHRGRRFLALRVFEKMCTRLGSGQWTGKGVQNNATQGRRIQPLLDHGFRNPPKLKQHQGIAIKTTSQHVAKGRNMLAGITLIRATAARFK